MSLQAKLGLDESEMLMDLFLHAYRCLGHTHTHRLPSVPIGLYALQHINTQLSYKGVHISSLLSISILTFPYTLYLPPPAYPHTCPLIPLSHCFLPRYPIIIIFYRQKNKSSSQGVPDAYRPQNRSLREIVFPLVK